MIAYLRIIGAVALKDIQLEWQSRQSIPVMLVFSLIVAFLFNYALQLSPTSQVALTAGLLWVTLAFAGTLGLNRSISHEQENSAIDGLLLAPVDRSAVFCGKTLSNLLFTLLVAVILIPVFSLLYGKSLINLSLLLIVFLGLSAYTALGTLLAALSMQTRTRDVLLPVLLFPLALPILIAAVQASQGVIDGGGLASVQNWVYLLLAGNGLFIAAGLLLFETIVEE